MPINRTKSALRSMQLLAVLLLIIVQGCSLERAEPLPDFSGYSDVKQKKQAFFSYLLPLIEMENQRILGQRSFVERQLSGLDDGQPLARAQRQRVLQLAGDYGLKQVEQLSDRQLIEATLRRVDIVPPSLALAQAANESAWGTSRFAVQGNNLFGQWCFTEGCGIVPNSRVKGAGHEVRRFSSPAQSVSSYVRNINSSFAYESLRTTRENLRRLARQPTGLALVSGLSRYSERGEDYVREISAMIQYNHLQEFDYSSAVVADEE